MPELAWAKYAADDIVSDDDIDEAATKKTDSRDWLKWALGIGLLGAGGYAAVKYSPELSKALSGKLFSTATPANKAVNWATGGFRGNGAEGISQSPVEVGAGIGAAAAVPFGGPLTRQKVLNGLASGNQTLHEQSTAVGHAPSVTGGRGNSDTSQAAEIHKAWTDAGHHGIAGGWASAGGDPNSAVAALANLHRPGAAPEGLVLGKGIGPQYFKAVRQTTGLAQNARTLGSRLNQTVNAPDPVTKAMGPRRIIDLEAPEAAAHLSPEQLKDWELHNRLHRESGVAGINDLAGKPVLPRSKLDLGRISTAIEKSRLAQHEFSWPHLGTNVAGGAVAGAAGGWLYNSTAGKISQ